MSTELDDDSGEYKYRVLSVEKREAPAGLPAGDWHRYIIGRGTSKIEGSRIGTLYAVTQYAETAAEDLNARAARGQSSYVMTKRK
ncbi:MAG: hypothetical protein AMJ69_07380 [Gammaproteobacteria bacterium SG8_47]|nr:MAG: hypothetical protein AMJ69_07380 [Gammaproteobacteria bacterium SG8_47]